MTLSPTPSSATKVIEREQRPSPLQLIVIVGLLTFSALQLAWLGWKHDPRVHVAAPIAIMLAVMLLVAAAIVVLKALGRGDHLDWLAAPILLGMTVSFGWVGFFGDPRYCSAQGPLLLPLPSCHTGFKAFAVMLLLMTAMAARSTWRRWRFIVSRKPPRAM